MTGPVRENNWRFGRPTYGMWASPRFRFTRSIGRSALYGVRVRSEARPSENVVATQLRPDAPPVSHTVFRVERTEPGAPHKFMQGHSKTVAKP